MKASVFFWIAAALLAFLAFGQLVSAMNAGAASPVGIAALAGACVCAGWAWSGR